MMMMMMHSRTLRAGHLRGHGILDLFDAVVTCEDVQNGKPAPDLYLLAAEKLGVDPTRCGPGRGGKGGGGAGIMTWG